MKILIVYAGKYGTTHAVCEILKSRFTAAGDTVTISRADALESPQSYDALVLACPLYLGKWIKYFAEYIERYKAHMNDQPVAVCTVGYTLKDGDEKNLNIAKNASAPLRVYTKPVIEGYFAGRVNMEILDKGDRDVAILAKMKEGDYLDTEAVLRWADEARELLASSQISV
ncbi:MAG: flavodoxin domain-containing protein [Methanomicrobiales archaeon]|jgi:menaquinone-dependent protoporphyrinogen oxidase|nr:flavodoxin domain-containing protein [Methanomicrobiales archaeon]